MAPILILNFLINFGIFKLLVLERKIKTGNVVDSELKNDHNHNHVNFFADLNNLE